NEVAGNAGRRDAGTENLLASIDDGEVERHRGERNSASSRKQDFVGRVLDPPEAVFPEGCRAFHVCGHGPVARIEGAEPFEHGIAVPFDRSDERDRLEDGPIDPTSVALEAVGAL